MIFFNRQPAWNRRRYDADLARNIEYVGAGKSAYDPNPGSTVLAYDRMLLQEGKGTYAVFRDDHAEFIEPERFSKYGLPVGN